MKYTFYYLILIILCCQCTKTRDRKREILNSEYHDDGLIETTKCKFIMYSDSTYIFTVNQFQEYRHEKNEIFRGRFFLNGDSIIFFPFSFYFVHSDKALMKNGYIEFLESDFPFKMKITSSSLKQSYSIDTVKFNDYSFFRYDSSFHRNFSGNLKPYDLNNADLMIIDSILNSCINENSKYISFKLTDYFKQCVAVRNSKGEREIWINLLCKGKDSSYLYYDIVYVSDGGDCFLNLKVNIDKHTYYELYINGGA